MSRTIRLSIVAFVLAIVAHGGTAQVTIKERVEIAPANVAPTGPVGGDALSSFYTPCNPPPSDGDNIGDTTRVAVFYGGSVSLSSLTCGGCPGHHMSGALTQGAEYARLVLNNEPHEYCGEINGTSFHFRESCGYDVIPVFDQVQPDDSAVVSFTMTYVDFPEPNQQWIEVIVVRQEYEIDAGVFYSTVEYGSNSMIRLLVADQCGGGLPSPLTFTASIVAGSTRGVLDPYRIIGINPDTHTVKVTLTPQQQVIVFQESEPKWCHFNAEGFPAWGTPHGYGLMQLDPSTDQEVWDWRANRSGGLAVIGKKYADAVGLGERIREGDSRSDWYPIRYANATNLTTDGELWKETFQRYRGGSYWRWYPDNQQDPQTSGEWVADPQGGHKRGEVDWQIYLAGC